MLPSFKCFPACPFVYELGPRDWPTRRSLLSCELRVNHSRKRSRLISDAKTEQSSDPEAVPVNQLTLLMINN